ncbi:hypothetical protein SACE_7265 [Saccharopolyspora erythraea NRRL 2338]|uniref:Uncharacterized protein n=1 Tax=Saccharopolyspora erythraea (strain ATCC 11635 / DSM 40517 / JCM 4748 / NBRC 13426 / NCIMB 8594 / NRRL 2338) TaxID=405948 RepID=A4FQU8_SACEN|nr:hypothetical protein N599_13240 [Saccharopolyspora erythraea D]QRK94051.1 hypothetical protein JQX30_36370 [Saccharopolyspora erythraea]CAM06423.1 hypothetical protein SACE_7265 [Saccharopolyspora erythraea NRRL 2338]
MEYEIFFITREAQKGWQDCLAVARNATVQAWERLTTAPTHEDERLYRLSADFAVGTYGRRTFERYQYKITNGGRLWYFVEPTPRSKVAGRVLLERCMTGHPKETEPR